MDKIELADFNKKLPASMQVSVIMEKKSSDHQWADFSYKAVGVVCTSDLSRGSLKTIYRDDGVERYMVSGLEVKLHADECESYYHNLMSPQPGCFIVANETDSPDEMPVPHQISLSFDEVHAALETDGDVYTVDIPPELYQWAEAFILTHYVAIEKIKRKRKDWKTQERK